MRILHQRAEDFQGSLLFTPCRMRTARPFQGRIGGLLAGESVEAAKRSAIAKASRRLIPFLVLCYAVNFLDRMNVGYAAFDLRDRRRHLLYILAVHHRGAAGGRARLIALRFLDDKPEQANWLE